MNLREITLQTKILEELLVTTQEGFWLIDNEAMTLDVNPAMCQILGRPREDIIGRSIFDFADTANTEVLHREIASRNMGKHGSYEIALLRADGANVPCINNATAVFDDDGRKVAAIGLWTDISEIRQAEGKLKKAYDVLETTVAERTAELSDELAERKRVEESLRENEARTRAIVETAVDGIITIDEHGIVENFNTAAERMFGYSAKEVIGKNIKMLMPEPDASNHDGYLANYLRTGDTKIIGIGREVVGQRKNGDIFPLHLAVSEMSVSGKRMFTGILRDISEQKEIEERLRDSEARFRDALEVSTDWFWEMGPDLRYTYVAPRFFEETGYEPEDIIGKTRMEFVGPESTANNPELWRTHEDDLRNHRVIRNFEYFQQDKNALRRYVRVSAMPFFNENGVFRGYRGTATSITEQKESEEALKESAAAFRQAERIANIHHWVSDATFVNWIVASENTEHLFGVPVSELVGDHSKFLSFIHPDDQERVVTLYEEVKSNLEPYEVEYRFCRPDGVMPYIREIGEPVFDDQGNVTHFRGVTQDITSRHEVEQALRESQEQGARAAEVANLCHWRASADMEEWLWTSGNTNQVIGMPVQELLGAYAKYLSRVHPDDRERIADSYAEIRRNHQPYEIEYRVIGDDGVTRYLWEIGEPEYDAEGAPVSYRGMTQNITDRKIAELEAIQAKEAADKANLTKSEFMSSMSHELRTPLNAIIGFSGTIMEEVFGPLSNDKYREYLADIHNSGQHLLELINDILDASAIEAGALELHEENINPADVIEASVRLIRPRAEDGQVSVNASIDPEICLLYVDQRRVRQVMLNLLSNAVKFTPAGGEVSVSARLNGNGSFSFAVDDTGAGMDVEEIETAMSKFGQVDSGLDRKHEGSGLGLPLTKGLMELHGGDLEIKSKKGKGTLVTVTFPEERVVQYRRLRVTCRL